MNYPLAFEYVYFPGENDRGAGNEYLLEILDTRKKYPGKRVGAIVDVDFQKTPAPAGNRQAENCPRNRSRLPGETVDYGFER